jgi:hypothetical protein
MSKRFQIIAAGAAIVILLAVVFYILTTGEEGMSGKKEKTSKTIPEVNLLFLGGTYSSSPDWNRFLARKDADVCALLNLNQREIRVVFENCVWEKNPKICFVNCGQEDVVSKTPKTIILENYEKVLNRLMKRDVRPVIQSAIRIPNLRDNMTNTIDEINIELKILADRLGLDYINITDVLCDNEGLKEKYSSDGIRLNNEGYKVWAKEIKAYLKENPIDPAEPSPH